MTPIQCSFLYLFTFFLTCVEPKINDANTDTLVKKPTEKLVQQEKNLINPNGTTIQSRFLVPDGFQRVTSNENSFASYLQNLPLKRDGSQVKYYNGATKNASNVYVAVVDMEIGKRDLQQCADAVMRLRGEYLWHQKQYDAIHFNFTNGFRVDYAKWMQGNRMSINGNTTKWIKSKPASNTYQDFRKYMDLVFAYAGTLSLSKELKKVDFAEMQIGDVFIQGGSPGHAIIVVDKALNKETGEQLFLLAQSYMPAQETQILQNPMNSTLSPWYSNQFSGNLGTPEWTFSKTDLKRFE